MAYLQQVILCLCVLRQQTLATSKLDHWELFLQLGSESCEPFLRPLPQLL